MSTSFFVVKKSEIKNRSGIASTIHAFGGEGGIRTHGTLAGTAVFKTATFSQTRSPLLAREIITDRLTDIKVLRMTAHFVVCFYG